MEKYIQALQEIANHIENNYEDTHYLPMIIKLQIMNLKTFNGNYPDMFIDNLKSTLGIMILYDIDSISIEKYKNIVLKLMEKKQCLD